MGNPLDAAALPQLLARDTVVLGLEAVSAQSGARFVEIALIVTGEECETMWTQKAFWDDLDAEAGDTAEQSVDLEVGELPRVVVVDVVRLAAEASEQVASAAHRVPVRRP